MRDRRLLSRARGERISLRLSRALPAALLLSTAAAGILCCLGPRQPDEVHVGLNIFTGSAPLARAMRTYAPPAGAAPVRLHKFSSYADSLRAFRNGRLDLVLMTQYDALLLRSRGVPLTAVAVIDHSLGADAIVCQPRYTSLRALRGRRIGLQAESVSYFLLLQELERQHLEVDDFELVHLSPNLVEAAFERQQVDAAVLWEPFVSNLGRRGRTLATSRSIEIPIVDLLWVRSDRLERLREDLVPLLRHYFMALGELGGNTDALYAELAAEDRVTPREVRVALGRLRMFGPRENLELARLASADGPAPPPDTGLRQAAEFMYRKTILDVPVSTEDMFDASLIRAALESSP